MCRQDVDSIINTHSQIFFPCKLNGYVLNAIKKSEADLGAPVIFDIQSHHSGTLPPSHILDVSKITSFL